MYTYMYVTKCIKLFLWNFKIGELGERSAPVSKSRKVGGERFENTAKESTRSFSSRVAPHRHPHLESGRLKGEALALVVSESESDVKSESEVIPFWFFIFLTLIYVIYHVYTFIAIWDKMCKTTILWVYYSGEVGVSPKENKNPCGDMDLKKNFPKVTDFK